MVSFSFQLEAASGLVKRLELKLKLKLELKLKPEPKLEEIETIQIPILVTAQYEATATIIPYPHSCYQNGVSWQSVIWHSLVGCAESFVGEFQ